MNPFRPPASSELSMSPLEEAELATLMQRLAGKIVDRLLVWGCFIPVGFSALLFPGELNAVGDREPSEITLGVAVLCGLAMIALNICNWVLITRQGQTFGKIVAGTRIVRLSGLPVDFVSGVILRNWLLGLVTGVLNQCCLGWGDGPHRCAVHLWTRAALSARPHRRHQGRGRRLRALGRDHALPVRAAHIDRVGGAGPAALGVAV